MKIKLNWILLVDDYESDNFLHSRLIRKTGITDHIFTAMNGREAIDLLTGKSGNSHSEMTRQLPGLIFLDLNMPVMDGWEFLEDYQRSDFPQKSASVIIILTTSINPADKSKAEQMLESGCFLYKPLSKEMIYDILERKFPGSL